MAGCGNWHMVRMNLNTFARQGVFEIDGMAQVVADKLRDPGNLSHSFVTIG